MLQKHGFYCVRFFCFCSRAGETSCFFENVAHSHAICSFFNQIFQSVYKNIFEQKNKWRGGVTVKLPFSYIFLLLSNVRTNLRLYECTHESTLIRMYVRIYAYTNVLTNLRLYECTYESMLIRMYVRIYAYTNVSTNLRLYVCMHE